MLPDVTVYSRLSVLLRLICLIKYSFLVQNFSTLVCLCIYHKRNISLEFLYVLQTGMQCYRSSRKLYVPEDNIFNRTVRGTCIYKVLNAQVHQSLHCSHAQSMDVNEDSDQNLTSSPVDSSMGGNLQDFEADFLSASKC